MKLSEAIMLGSTTCKMIPGDVNSCALGAACNAMGIPKHVERPNFVIRTTMDTIFHLEPYCSAGTFFNRYAACEQLWPWLSDAESAVRNYGQKITSLFDYGVCGGHMTLECLADYVRSVEPACGECNQFNCACASDIEQCKFSARLQEACVA